MTLKSTTAVHLVPKSRTLWPAVENDGWGAGYGYVVARDIYYYYYFIWVMIWTFLDCSIVGPRDKHLVLEGSG